MTDHLILVFGAAVDAHGYPRAPLVRRLRQAMFEAAQDATALVIVSGGSVHGRPAEAPAMRDWLVSEGLGADRILLEALATSTAENARYGAELIAARDACRVTLVTERYHLRRARFMLARALAARGLQVALRTSAAPDQLGIFKRISSSCVELLKLAQDICER